MDIEFDAAKDAANLAKHGVSLARAADLDLLVAFVDPRFTDGRLLGYGLLDGLPHSLAFAVTANGVRAISFRRCHLKEYRRHVR